LRGGGDVHKAQPLLTETTPLAWGSRQSANEGSSIEHPHET